MDRVEIINRALSRIGCLPIQSVAEPGPQGTGVLHTYDAVLENIISQYPWHFATPTESLSRLAETPPLGWSYAFRLPHDRLALPRAYYESADWSRPTTCFQVSEAKVFANSETLFAEYQRLPEPATWPGYFRELVTLALAAEYALEIREDRTLRAQLRNEAFGPDNYPGEGGLMKIAMELDAQANPSKQAANGRNPLTEARFDGYHDDDDARAGW